MCLNMQDFLVWYQKALLANRKKVGEDSWFQNCKTKIGPKSYIIRVDARTELLYHESSNSRANQWKHWGAKLGV